MAEKNKGRLGGLLGQRDDGGAQGGGDGAPAPTEAETHVQAYEEDWYRSLKALAERQAELEAMQGEDEEDSGTETSSSGTVQTAEPAEAPPAEAAEQTGPEGEIAASATSVPTQPAAGPTEGQAPQAEEQAPASKVIIHLEPGEAGQAAPGEAPAASIDAATRTPSLTSTHVEERRMALEALAARGLSDADAEQVGAVLLDPDRDIRRLALEALAGKGDRLDDSAVRQALQDPTDEVRAAAVRLAAERGTRDLAELAALVGARRWPLTQQNVLEVLPGLIGSGAGLDDAALGSALTSVAEMESGPLDDERSLLGSVARAVGVDRLVAALSLPDQRRLGAARLLVEEGSPTALGAVAGHTADPMEEVRTAAATASGLLADLDRAGAAAEPARDAPGAAEVEQAAEAEMITALARALQDPDQSVRDRAKTALAEINRTVIRDWVRDALREDEVNVAALAAGVAELLGLSEVAEDILERGVDLPPEARGPFVGALSSFQMEPQTVAAKLESIDVSRRPEGVRLVWHVLGNAVLPYLRGHLADSAGAVRMAVLEVLGESDEPTAVDVAAGALESDSSPAVRATAIKVIGRAGGDRRLAALSQALMDPDPDVRATAVEVLPEGLGVIAAQLLAQALADLDERVWQAAIRHLAALPESDMVVLWSALLQCHPTQREHLIAALERSSPDKLARLALDHLHSPEMEGRVLAVEMAGRAGTQPCVEASIQAMQDPSSPVRRAATESLALLRSPTSVEALGKALSDPDPEIRMGAVRALGVIDDEAVLGFLVSALKDPELRVRHVASEVLTQWSSPAVAKRLAGVLSVPNLREAAAELLAKMGPSAVELLIDVLMQATPEVVPTVGHLLSNIAGLDRFTERLASMDPAQRLRAVEAVGAIGGPAAVDALIGALSDPDERIRARSVQLLGNLGDPRALEPVKRCFLGDPVPEVVAAAEVTVARLGGG
ncbi:MAG: HEAT repeat domain-containing protein [Actinobacteria bacterium]|nr:HEAT repeat domain-containing protein [Actinomycetota bacterium]